MKTLSPYLKEYIKEFCNSEGYEKIETLQDFMDFKDKSGNPINPYYMLCMNPSSPFDHKRLIQDCLDLGVPIDYGYSSPPLLNASWSRPDLALFLIEKGAYNEKFKEVLANNAYHSLISYAIGANTLPQWIPDKVELLEKLITIEKHFNPNLQNKGVPLIHRSVPAEIVQWLLDKGANPLKCNPEGRNALGHHRKSGIHHKGAVKVLEQYFIQKKSKDEHKAIMQVIENKEMEPNKIITTIISPEKPSAISKKNKMIL